MSQSNEINELAKALVSAQKEMKEAKKEVTNTFFKAKYADLASVHDAIRDCLTKHGLCWSQSVGSEVSQCYSNVVYSIETKLIHTSGQWLSSMVLFKPVKNDPQSAGSAITYFRRYALSAIVGLTQDDDDGNSATGNVDHSQQVNNNTSKPEPDKKVPSKAHNELESHLMRLKWPTEQIKGWLKNRYGVKRLSELSDDQCNEGVKWLSDVNPTGDKKDE